MTENKKTNLEWFASTKTVIERIDIRPLDNSKRYFRFAIPKPNVDFKKTIAKNKINQKKKYSEYNLYPYWNIYFRGKEYPKDMKQIYHYLVDSLLEYQPFFVINSRNFRCLYGNLVNLKIINYGHMPNSFHKHYVYFDILLEKSVEFMPARLKKVEITLKSKLLPNGQYEYGYCGSLDGRFRNCTLNQYFNYGGGTFDVHPWGYCQTFNKAKGNSNIKCKIDIGT